MTGTDLAPYAGAPIEQYQPGLAMTPEAAKALDAQVRACTKAVLREGTDYGIIPGTGGGQTLWRPGAQKLLQWFGLGFTCDRVDVDLDDDGRKLGVTYRATVVKRLPDGQLVVLATCEGYAGYDEDKFYQTAEQVQRRAEDRERMWAKKDRRVPNPEKWKTLGEYRAPWNSVIKRAQKRAIVGATIDATAAGGVFSQDEEEDTTTPVPDDGPSWYEAALEQANTFTTGQAGEQLAAEAEQAARDGLCTRGQAQLIVNRVKTRARQLQDAKPVDAEELGRQAVQDPSPAAPDETPASGPAAGEGTAAASWPAKHGGHAAPGDLRHRRLIGAVQGHFKRLGFADADKADRLWAAAKIARVQFEADSLNDFDHDELKIIAEALGKCKDRDQLEVLLATGEAPDGGDTP